METISLNEKPTGGDAISYELSVHVFRVDMVIMLLYSTVKKLLLRLFASLLYTSNYENSGPKGPFLIHKNSF